MAYSSQEILDYLNANPNMSDAQIAKAMDQYGVSPAQMAQATGLGAAAVQQRYNAASPQGQYYTAPSSVTTATTATPTRTNVATQPITNTATQPVTNTATQPVTNTATQPVTNTATQPVTNTATQPVTNTSTTAAPTSNLPAYQQTNQQQGVAGYAQPYVGSMLGATMGQLFNTDQSGNITGMKGYTPYSYNPADYYAAFTPMQQQAFNTVSQMQTPGQFGQASQAANAGILSALGAGNRYGQMVTNPYAAAAFMSPYYQNVVGTQMQEAKRQAGIAAQTQQAQAAKAGAFGGARDLIQRQQANAELQRNLQGIEATGLQNAYTQAMQNMQNVANLGLQGAQTGITGAGTLGQLGTSQLGAQQGIANLQSTMGQQQQQQQQNIINQGVQNYQTAQQYPYMQLGFMQNMLQGLPVTTTAQQTYQQPPSTLSQLAGLGTTALGLNTLSGGALGSGLSSLWGSLTGAKAGGSTKDIKNRAPAGLAELALSKM